MVTADNPTVVALIPARGGSKRVPGKNIRPLGGHPLIAYTITAALDSGVFDKVVVSSDSPDTNEIAAYYGADVSIPRPAEYAGDKSPDIEWIVYTLDVLKSRGENYDAFSILRPTSPFRLPATIQRAWQEFLADRRVDSLRAVEPVEQHPGKMWIVRSRRLLPLLPFDLNGTPWHSNQYAALPRVYVQNASLEIAWTTVATEYGTIAGETLVPFITEGYEGFDINNALDWPLAELLVNSGEAQLPTIKKEPWKA